MKSKQSLIKEEKREGFIKKINNINPNALKKGAVLLVGATVLVGTISILKDNEHQLPIETIQDTMSEDTNYETSSSSEDELVYESTIYSGYDSNSESSVNHESLSGDCFIVNVDNLNLRDDCNTDSKVHKILDKGTKIYLRNEKKSYNDGEYLWYYVSCHIHGGLYWGWIAAVDYTQDIPVYNVVNQKSINVDCSNKEKSQLDAKINAESAIVVDIDTGTVLYEKNSNLRVNPASATKILSNYVALENVPYGINSELYLTYSYDNINVDGHASEGYGLGESQVSVKDKIKEGAVVEFWDAHKISLLLSENSSTLALEEFTEDYVKKEGKKFNFIEEMNNAAERMGCINFNFTNSYGYAEDSHYITARDMAKILSHITKHEPAVVWTMGVDYHELGSLKFKNQSKLLDKDSRLYYDSEVIACQTGASEASMVTIYNKDGRNFAVITFNGTYTDSKYDDAMLLSEYIDNVLEKNNDLIDEVSTTDEKVKVIGR